jgi:tetratricopeptide (TPR) repeat protein
MPLPKPLAIHHPALRWIDMGAEYQDSASMSQPIAQHLTTLLQQANALLRSGRFAEAVIAYEQAVRLAPANTDILISLGGAQKRAGRIDACIETYRRVLRQKPGFVEGHYNLGNAFLEAGRPDDAARAYRRALSLRPGYPEAENNLGHALLALGESEAALDIFTALRERAPGQAEPHANVGAACFNLRRFDDSARAYEAALALRPGDVELWRKRLGAEQARGAGDAVIACLRAIQSLRPDDAGTLHDLGKRLIKPAPEEAAALLTRVLALQPDHLEAVLLLAGTLLLLDRCEEALAALDAFPVTPETEASVLASRGTVLRNLMRLEEAEAVLTRAVTVQPDHASAVFSLGLQHLMAGRYDIGFALYEQRFAASLPERVMEAPRWRGEDFHGRTLLVHAEQGLGDTLQFCRFVPQAARFGRVLVMAPPSLLSLLGTLDGAEGIFSDAAPPPAHDLQIPMMSLPAALGTTLESLPCLPYLRADAERMASWQARLAGCGGLKIGLCWAGNPENTQDRARSIPFGQMAALLAVPGMHFVSLQKDHAERYAAANFSDFTGALGDFAETAALIGALDLVISVDTSVAHLCGALGRPLWLLNRFNTEWRWMADRADSPWYPGHRLFRQPRPHDWAPVLNDVRTALYELL